MTTYRGPEDTPVLTSSLSVYFVRPNSVSSHSRIKCEFRPPVGGSEGFGLVMMIYDGWIWVLTYQKTKNSILIITVNVRNGCILVHKNADTPRGGNISLFSKHVLSE
jgi:hypothetical protein